jgi:hypothetical protein
MDGSYSLSAYSSDMAVSSAAVALKDEMVGDKSHAKSLGATEEQLVSGLSVLSFPIYLLKLVCFAATKWEGPRQEVVLSRISAEQSKKRVF